MLERNENAEITSILRISYDHLPSKHKHCFAYCSLFPKDYRFNKQELIYLWKAQGYIESDEEEFSFMNLLRRGFFQEAKENDCGEIESCKMHDIMHDLAVYVAGKESIMLSGTSSNDDICPRHVSLVVDDERNESWSIPTSLLNVKSLRSCLLSCSSSQSSICCHTSNLDQLCSNFKMLRTLSLSGLGITDIPPSIGELKQMRYLDLSANKFEDLPNSITNLVNLLALNLRASQNLKVWPSSFRKLVNLRYLNIKDCPKLWLMPEGIEKLTCLLHLSDLMVRKESELDAVDGFLQQLRGCLLLKAYWDEEEENECKWNLPVSLIRLDILGYPGERIPGWGNNERINNLVFLRLIKCEKVRYLPPLRWLPSLKILHLECLRELEFMEEEDNTRNNANSIFFPCLEELRLTSLEKFKGWWREIAEEATSSAISSASSFKNFPLLSRLAISGCGKIKLMSFPLCPHLRKLEFFSLCYKWPRVTYEELPSTIFCSSTSPSLDDIVIQTYKVLSSFQGEALTSLRKVFISRCEKLISVQLASPLLQKMVIINCKSLTSIELVETPTPSLRFVTIDGCGQLESLHISSNLIESLEKLKITKCPSLRLVQQGSGTLSNPGGCSRTRIIKLEIYFCDVWIENLLSTLSSLEEISISEREGLPDGLKILHLAASPRLQRVSIKYCSRLTSVEIEAPTDIEIVKCCELKKFHIAQPNSLNKLAIDYSGSECASWDSLSNLRDCRYISVMKLESVGGVFVERLLLSSSLSLRDISNFNCTEPISFPRVPLPSLERLDIRKVDGLKNLHLAASPQRVSITNCPEVTSVELDAPIDIEIIGCSKLKNFRIAQPNSLNKLVIVSSDFNYASWDSLSNLGVMKLERVSGVFVEQLISLSSSSLRDISISNCTGPFSFPRVALPSLERLDIRRVDGLESLHLALPRLQNLVIFCCDGLTIIDVEASFVISSFFMIYWCNQLKSVRFPHPNALEQLAIGRCPELQFSTGVDWDSLSNLCYLELLPPLEELPGCLVQRQAQNQLQIIKWNRN